MHSIAYYTLSLSMNIIPSFAVSFICTRVGTFFAPLKFDTRRAWERERENGKNAKRGVGKKTCLNLKKRSRAKNKFLALKESSNCVCI